MSQTQANDRARFLSAMGKLIYVYQVRNSFTTRETPVPRHEAGILTAIFRDGKSVGK